MRLLVETDWKISIANSLVNWNSIKTRKKLESVVNQPFSLTYTMAYFLLFPCAFGCFYFLLP